MIEAVQAATAPDGLGDGCSLSIGPCSISGSLGKGHDVLAEACAAALEAARRRPAATVDAMGLLGRRAWRGRGTGSSGGCCRSRPCTTRSTSRSCGMTVALAGLMDRLAVDWMFPHLRARLVERLRPSARSFPVFATGAGAAARLKARGLPGDLSGRP